LVGTVIGAVIGGLIVLADTWVRQRRIEKGKKKIEDTVPEDRLTLAMIGGILFPATMFWFAWSAEYK
jgi:DHA1 family multidrug resistance protein-like MFS transporter